MKPQEPKIDHSQFMELHKHKGSENYEVIEILDKKFEIDEPMLDSETGQTLVYGKTEPAREQDFTSKRVKVSVLGDIVGNGITNARIENDGSLHGFDFYSNWIINGDTVKHKYIDPFSKKEIDAPYEFKLEEKDPKKWLEMFKEVYDYAQYVHIDMSNYYFKVHDKWYLIKAYKMGKANNIDIKKLYPPKEVEDVRMLELDNVAPLWYHKGFKERDTSLIKMMEYDSQFYTEENVGLDTYKYSAGWWYLEVYMPLGDTLRIKRYSYFEDPELKLYKIPSAYGGRYDVLFIVQKPKDSHVEQVAGMYAIRPRDPEQPEYRYKSISYGDVSKGQPYILDYEEMEDYKAWTAKKKG